MLIDGWVLLFEAAGEVVKYAIIPGACLPTSLTKTFAHKHKQTSSRSSDPKIWDWNGTNGLAPRKVVR